MMKGVSLHMAFLARKKLRLPQRCSALPTQPLLGQAKLGRAPYSMLVHRMANKILRKASAYFVQTELDRPFKK